MLSYFFCHFVDYMEYLPPLKVFIYSIIHIWQEGFWGVKDNKNNGWRNRELLFYNLYIILYIKIYNIIYKFLVRKITIIKTFLS